MVRIKHRYLLVNILYPNGPTAAKASKEKRDAAPDTLQIHHPTSDGLTIQLILSMIRRGVGELFGDYGAGMIGGSLKVMYFSPATSTIIIRVARAHYRLVWAALTYTTRLPRPVDELCVFRVVRVSGTVRKAEEEVIRRAREAMRRARREAGEEAGDVDLGVLGLKVHSNNRRVGESGIDNDVGGIEDDDTEMDEDEDNDDGGL
ncbi:MAG: hypothetical protein M1821_000460 [Bathelium mastoideum]|nr:MAG: hypothetical protein M1821_000460 [Bathelium mastoideum]KAI9686275.1 MAG: hypothetical protein M1822_003931 [Bathelium mastoideum]